MHKEAIECLDVIRPMKDAIYRELASHRREVFEWVLEKYSLRDHYAGRPVTTMEMEKDWQEDHKDG